MPTSSTGGTSSVVWRSNQKDVAVEADHGAFVISSLTSKGGQQPFNFSMGKRCSSATSPFLVGDRHVVCPMGNVVNIPRRRGSPEPGGGYASPSRRWPSGITNIAIADAAAGSPRQSVAESRSGTKTGRPHQRRASMGRCQVRHPLSVGSTTLRDAIFDQ